MTPPYRPIFFDDEWLLQKYRGWVLRSERPGIKILDRSYGIIHRVLVLCCGADDRAISKALTEDRTFAPSSEVIIHDFSSDGAAKRIICGRMFEPASERERLINKATFVLNLTEPRDALLQRMRQGFRQSIKKATESGISVAVKEAPEPNLIDRFVAAHNKMARDRALSLARRSDFEKMFRDGNLVMGVASLEDAHLSYALIYLSGATAYYLKGVSVGDSNDDAGKYLHYELVAYLKSRGMSWYDLGGVPEVNEKNGIYLFKKGFGGDLIRLGAEFVYRPRLIRGVRAGVRVLRTFRAKAFP